MGFPVFAISILLIAVPHACSPRETRGIWDLLTLPANIAIKTTGAFFDAGKAFNRAVTGRGFESGIIMLTGYKTPGLVNDGLCTGMKPFLSATVRIVCPTPPTTVGTYRGNLWFDEVTTDDLPRAVGLVESYIEDMMRYGIRSQDIVLVGMSQGGALTLYTALHTKYKLGGIVGIITYLPRLIWGPIELPKDQKNVVNTNTPVLHINGEDDTVIPLEHGRATRDALSQVMPDYSFWIYPGGHATCCVTNPLAVRQIVKWLDQKTSVSVRLCWIPFVC